ncbi:MAG: hypothetical protein ACYCWW_01530 [Deltaproteobacteria bacterium]
MPRLTPIRALWPALALWLSAGLGCGSATLSIAGRATGGTGTGGGATSAGRGSTGGAGGSGGTSGRGTSGGVSSGGTSGGGPSGGGVSGGSSGSGGASSASSGTSSSGAGSGSGGASSGSGGASSSSGGAASSSGGTASGSSGATSGSSGSCSAGTIGSTGSGLPIGSSESYLGQSGSRSVQLSGCNAVSYAQLPGQTDLFLGRLAQNASCSQWAIGLYRMDWTTSALALVGTAFQTPQTLSDGSAVTSAYDPTIIAYGGELWAAFECAGNFPGVGSCVGPFDPATGTIDASRTNQPITGTSAIPNDPYRYSASVPKLLAFQGQAYLYWSAVKQQKSDGSWVDITSRGALLAEEPSGLHRLWAAGHSGPIASYDPASDVEVWGVGSSSTTDTVADMQGVFTDGQHVFATAGLGGGTTCLTSPASGVPGCYQLAIARTQNPLAQGVFGGGDQLALSELPNNAQNYTRLFVAPDCSRNLMGIFYPPYSGAQNTLPSAFLTFPIPSDADFFVPAPAPQGAARLQVTFGQLGQLAPGCSLSTVTSSTCAAAASRACRFSYGYGAGFGPVQYLGQSATIVCVAQSGIVPSGAPFTSLAAYQSSCGQSSTTSVQCDAAVDDFCQAAGDPSGLGIEEYSPSQAGFACLTHGEAIVETVAWSSLTGYDGSCSLANIGSPEVCLPAVDDECRALGFVSGFGIQQYSASQAQLVCLH